VASSALFPRTLSLGVTAEVTEPRSPTVKERTVMFNCAMVAVHLTPSSRSPSGVPASEGLVDVVEQVLAPHG